MSCIIFQFCLIKGISYPNGQKQMLHLFTKKKKKKRQTCVKNYLPISLLQICNEVLNHVIYNAMFSCFLKSNLISEIQSGFKPSHSCINQLLAISQSLFSSFYENCQVRGNSLTFVARWNYS